MEPIDERYGFLLIASGQSGVQFKGHPAGTAKNRQFGKHSPNAFATSLPSSAGTDRVADGEGVQPRKFGSVRRAGPAGPRGSAAQISAQTVAHSLYW